MLIRNVVLPVLSCGALAVTETEAQVTITSGDMFNKIGQYYRVYSNLPGEEVDVSNIILEAGEDQVWDFTDGPDEETIRFDYIDVDDSGSGDIFEDAAFVERATYESDESKKLLFLKQVTGRGRMVYGFRDESIDPINPDVPFTVPLNDFPNVIQYQDQWTASTVWETVTRSELLGDLEVPTRYAYRSEMEVDAYGIVILPELGFDDCLRINELVTYKVSVDLTGGFQEIATYFTRNYYWLSKNKGIVAQMTSAEDSVPPPDEYSAAIAFWRQFENNHKEVDEQPMPVQGLKITLDAKNSRVLLSWNKTKNATGYRVEYTRFLGQPDGWINLKTTPGSFALDEIDNGESRFYRIVSLE